ncbi:hypothetical protein LZ24_00371 [Desulfobotulus alkaliphilus]|uniref:Alkylation response protein AidB-like acyl-CoA dehydrogenase n=1 Tax=Desulfobotulus alkaliphilus TaxID=622671 RepID=A0A562S8I4_9BACT|nr:acyl-CoA dehydrogenase [Desulfobotulus alkaliphilus]TWI76750.1 hypothetical protein LZ24_00371 [Desulfobotulus alkaliphilus]
MVSELADRRDQEFMLFEMFNLGFYSENVKFSGFNEQACRMLLKEARKLAVNEILPTNKLADVENGHPEGVLFHKGEIRVPRSYHRPYRSYCEGGWLAMCDEEEWGGQGMPHLLAAACLELFMGANPSFLNYPGLTHGAGAIVREFGNERLQKRYLANLFSGKWAGTMCLTEAQAGSDVGALTTKAIKNDDGSYSIEGNKIFISGADSDLVENVIHPVLARVEGAPSGTKGISLFLVPKYRLSEDGRTTDIRNDVEITGIEEKMGMHGNVTCTVAFGAKGACRGELVGEENKGMKYMFLMMNEARQGAALQALGISSASYANAVRYARERVQGPDLKEAFSSDARPVPIIQHPDVRRQLLFMKAFIEGNRFLSYYLKWCHDRCIFVDSAGEREKYQGLIELLTPISKAYTTDKGIEITSAGIQVYGGYGFIEEYPQAQYYRDVRISSLYEGTNGIQAMDLLGRKLGMKKGRAFMDLMGEINATIVFVRENGLDEMADGLENALKKAGEAAVSVGGAAMGSRVLDAFAVAKPFLDILGDLMMAWGLAWRAALACSKLGSASGKDRLFYQGQIVTAKYYYGIHLPEALGKMDAVKKVTDAVMEMGEDCF